MPSIYQPRRPRASPLWQLVHHGWNDLLAHYESRHRKNFGPLHPAATAPRRATMPPAPTSSGAAQNPPV